MGAGTERSGVQTENVQRQRELYGEPLADIAARITGALALTQGRLAQVLGLSAPMLSQLLSGHRAKIGNPAVLGRLTALTELAVSAHGLGRDEVERRVEAIAASDAPLSTVRTVHAAAIDALRASAPPAELARLAALSESPELATLLREAAGG